MWEESNNWPSRFEEIDELYNFLSNKSSTSVIVYDECNNWNLLISLIKYVYYYICLLDYNAVIQINNKKHSIIKEVAEKVLSDFYCEYENHPFVLILAFFSRGFPFQAGAFRVHGFNLLVTSFLRGFQLALFPQESLPSTPIHYVLLSKTNFISNYENL